MDFPGGTVVKNRPASAGDAGDMGLIPGSGRSPGVEMAKISVFLAWKSLWTEEPGRLQFRGSRRVGHDLAHTRVSSSIPGKLNRVYLLLINNA